MQFNENNAVMDVHRKGEKGHSHQFVSGNLTYTSKDKKEIKLWTPEGLHGAQVSIILGTAIELSI
jgi:hypothetical protein